MKKPADAETDENSLHKIENSTNKKYNLEDFVLSPSRFSPGGWKYILKNKIHTTDRASRNDGTYSKIGK